MSARSTPLPLKEGLGVGGCLTVRQPPAITLPYRVTQPTPDPYLAGRGES